MQARPLCNLFLVCMNERESKNQSRKCGQKVGRKEEGEKGKD